MGSAKERKAGNIKAVLFDMDGTLIDSIGVYDKVFDEIFRRFELPLPEKGLVAELMRQGRNPWTDFLPGMSFTKEMIIKAREIDKEVFPLMYEKHVSVFAGIFSLISELKNRLIKTAIVTASWFDENDPEQIKRLKEMVDVSITKFDTKRHKPYPDPILKACETLGVAPELSVYVGDTASDIKAGKAAGALTIGVLWGISTQKALAKEMPDEIASTVSELKGMVFSRI